MMNTIEYRVDCQVCQLHQRCSELIRNLFFPLDIFFVHLITVVTISSFREQAEPKVSNWIGRAD